MVFIIIVMYAVLAVYEFLPLYYERKSRELITNGTLFVLSLTTAIIISAGVSIPSPAGPIKNIITSIFGR